MTAIYCVLTGIQEKVVQIVEVGVEGGGGAGADAVAAAGSPSRGFGAVALPVMSPVTAVVQSRS